MKKLRIIYSKAKTDEDCVDLVATPQALAYIDGQKGREYLKPIDYLSFEDVKKTNEWVLETVLSMDNDWKKRANIFPFLIQAVGMDLCFLLDLLKTSDLVLSKIWNQGVYSHICIDSYKMTNWHYMIQYGFANYAYIDLINDEEWCDKRSIIAKRNVNFESKEEMDFPKDPFQAPYWKRSARYLRSLYRVSKKIGIISVILTKLGFGKLKTPELIVVPHKEVSEAMKCNGSINLNDYLNILPVNERKVEYLTSELLNSLKAWFCENAAAMNRLEPYKKIVQKRIINFIKKRKDLLTAYVQISQIENCKSLKMLLPSAVGCAVDAWSSMAIQEKGGVVASGQHGGGYGNAYAPYQLFSDFRFQYFFSYGAPSASFIFDFSQKYGKAKWIQTGSPVLYKIQKKCGPPPKDVRRILYIMDLCVHFRGSIPWESILQQFKVLQLLNEFSDKYVIHVKKEQTEAIKYNLYPGLNFINSSPADVMHQYDLLIAESALSTAVLEVNSTNKYLIIFTGTEWENVSKESLEMLSKRAECFHTWDDFLVGLEEILKDPRTNLDPAKLTSCDFMNTYCNPVSPEHYIETIKNTLKLP